MLDLISTVSNLLRETAETCILPVFGNQEANPQEKSPGEWVTQADKAGEAFLDPALRSLIPGSVVVGEEAASADPNVLNRLKEEESVWLVDPLDGTANFANGVSPFAIMVAYVREGVAVASWIFDPISNQLSVSEKGSGAWISGVQIKVDELGKDLSQTYGAVFRRFLPPEFVAHVVRVEDQFADLGAGSTCAGFNYPAIAQGFLDFTLYWRTLPWDHAPGVLFLTEAGGHAIRPDGSAYVVAEHSRDGPLVARNEEILMKVKSALFLS